MNILEDILLSFFAKKRPLEADISDNLKNAEEFFFMARTGVNFLGSHKSAVCHAIDNGCVCKFLIVNQHSPAIDYGQLRPIVDRKMCRCHISGFKKSKNMIKAETEWKSVF